MVGAFTQTVTSLAQAFLAEQWEQVGKAEAKRRLREHLDRAERVDLRLPQTRTDWLGRVDLLIDRMQVDLLEKTHVLKIDVRDQSTYVFLRRGSHWFEGSEKIDSLILAGFAR